VISDNGSAARVTSLWP